MWDDPQAEEHTVACTPPTKEIRIEKPADPAWMSFENCIEVWTETINAMGVDELAYGDVLLLAQNGLQGNEFANSIMAKLSKKRSDLPDARAVKLHGPSACVWTCVKKCREQLRS